MDEQRKTPPTQAEQLAVALDLVAAAPPPQQGATSGGVSLPSPGVDADRPGDLEDIDYDEMRAQINAVHQGPDWYRARILDYVICKSLAVMVTGSGHIRMVVALGSNDQVTAVMGPSSLSSMFSEAIDRWTRRQINKQQQCVDACGHSGCGCQRQEQA